MTPCSKRLVESRASWMPGGACATCDLKAELAKLTMLRGRGPLDGAEEKERAIVRLAPYRDGSIFASKFSGDSGWERHRQGEEIVEVVDGAATLHLLTDDGLRSIALSAGMMVIVPLGMWHRFDFPMGIADHRDSTADRSPDYRCRRPANARMT